MQQFETNRSRLKWREGISQILPWKSISTFHFAKKKCDYCDFLSGPSGPKEQADYVDALLEEINAAEEGKGRSVSSVFIGGHSFCFE